MDLNYKRLTDEEYLENPAQLDAEILKVTACRDRSKDRETRAAWQTELEKLLQLQEAK